jgi:hypothetical protein
MGLTPQNPTIGAGIWLIFDFMEKPGIEVIIFGMDRSDEKLFHKLV